LISEVATALFIKVRGMEGQTRARSLENIFARNEKVRIMRRQIMLCSAEKSGQDISDACHNLQKRVSLEGKEKDNV
jgi:hypothetical protein